MAVFQIDYDLHKIRKYEPLYAELRRNNFVHVFLSKWQVQSATANCESILAHFRNFVDSDDALMVTQVIDMAVLHPRVNPIPAPIALNTALARAVARLGTSA